MPAAGTAGQVRRRLAHPMPWLRRPDWFSLARLGLAARTGFYLLMCYLVVRLALLGGSAGRQANAHGALALVAAEPGGHVVLALAGVGFVLLGVLRMVAAVRDSDSGWVSRVTTGLQGLLYLGVASVPVSFLAGNGAAGSEQQQHSDVAQALAEPAGRPLLALVGVVLVLVCGWQIRTAVSGDYEKGADLDGTSRFVKRLYAASGAVGIAARALVFAPVGVLLVVAAVTADPARADGLDGELATLARHAWGLAVLCVVALGLAVFCVYSALETRYRDVQSAQ
jgi:hypothetical protein